MSSSNVLIHCRETIRLGTKVRRPDSLQKIAMPEFENQQAPDSAGMVAPSAKMLFQQLAHAFGLEISALQCLLLQQDRHNQVLQFVPHPVHERQRKTLLRSVERLTRHAYSLGKLAENVFLLSSTELPLGGQPGHPFHEQVIENGHAHLKRSRHAHP